jgi:hypothetical protein
VVTAFALDVSFLAGSTFVDTVVTLAGTINEIGPPAGLPCIAATSGLRASLRDARLLLPSSRGAGFAVLLRTTPLLLNAWSSIFGDPASGDKCGTDLRLLTLAVTTGAEGPALLFSGLALLLLKLLVELL